MATAEGDHCATIQADIAEKFVTFPSDLPEWPNVRRKLKALLQVTSPGSLTQALHEIFRLVQTDAPLACASGEVARSQKNVFQGLHKFFAIASVEEKEIFFRKTFPCIVQRALEIETLRPSPGLVLNRKQTACQVELSRKMVASVIACGFLCLFPGRRLSRLSTFNAINFDQFFMHLGNPAQQAKLRCILQYFERLMENPLGPPGNILFKRQVIRPSNLPQVAEWMDCDVPLCEFTVEGDGFIEDSGAACVHEEIRFSCCPELMAAMLFMEEMDDNEAIFVEGFETFSKYSGYGKTLQYDGSYIDPSPLGSSGNLDTHLCCMDALPASRIGGSYRQYHSEWILRELNKSYTGFASCSAGPGALIAHVEEKRASAGGTVNEMDATVGPMPDVGLCHCTAGEAASIVSVAAEQAMSLLPGRPAAEAAETSHTSARLFRRGLSDSESSSSDQLSGSPPHVDQDRSWQFLNRRRSSNLSDSSRRSSCSTRSTATTEFSSEFEEYYESFQRREHNLKDTAIKEEEVTTAGHPAVVEDFAQSLIDGIFQEGMTKASSLVPRVQEFGKTLPTGSTVKPVAVRPQALVGDAATANADADICASLADESTKLDEAAGGITDDQKGRILFYVDTMMDTAMKSSREHVQAHADNQENIQVQVASDFVQQIFQQVMGDPGMGQVAQGTRSKQGLRNTTISALERHNESLLSVPGKRYAGTQRHQTNSGCLGLGTAQPSELQSTGIVAALENAENLSDDQKARLMSGVTGLASTSSCISSVVAAASPTMPFPSLDLEDAKPQEAVKKSVHIAEGLSYSLLKKINDLTEDIMSCALSQAERSWAQVQQPATTRSRPEWTSETPMANCMDETMTGLIELYVEDLLDVAFVDAGADLVQELERQQETPTDKEVDPELFVFAEDFVDKVMQDALLIFERDYFPDGRRRYSEQRSIEETWYKPLERFRTNSQYFLAEFSPDSKAKADKRVGSQTSLSEPLSQVLLRRASLDDGQRVRPQQRPASVGFQDLILSDFEDELRRSNPSIPQFQLLDPDEIKPLYKRRASEPAHLMPCSDRQHFELQRFPLGDTTSSREMILDWLNSARRDRQQRHRQRQRTTSSHLDWYAQDILLEAFNDAFVQMFGRVLPMEQHIPRACDMHSNHIPADVESYISCLVDSAFSHSVFQEAARRSGQGPLVGNGAAREGEMISFAALVDGATQLADRVIQEAVEIVTMDTAAGVQQKISGQVRKPVATGNWGCGAYKGDPQLKALIQWASASWAGTPHLIYYTCQHEDLHMLSDVVSKLRDQNFTVGRLLRCLFSYCNQMAQRKACESSPDLLTVLLRDDLPR